MAYNSNISNDSFNGTSFQNDTFSESLTTIKDELTTRILGFLVMLISSPGLYFNLYAFFHFLTVEKSCFYLLCISKTLSNSLVLLVNLVYNGPCAILDTILGSNFTKNHLNQAIGFGVYLLGPLTQALVSINRLLVVWNSPNGSGTPKSSTMFTVLLLSVLWLIALYFSTLIGLSNPCLTNFQLDPKVLESCDNFLLYLVFHNFHFFVICSGVFSNCINVIVFFKLIMISCTPETLASEVNKKAHRTTIRLFSQSCFQDWIYVADMLKSFYITKVFLPDPVIAFLTGIGTNVAVHVADGFVMFIFHYGAAKQRKKGLDSMFKVSPRMSKGQI